MPWCCGACEGKEGEPRGSRPPVPVLRLPCGLLLFCVCSVYLCLGLPFLGGGISPLFPCTGYPVRQHVFQCSVVSTEDAAPWLIAFSCSTIVCHYLANGLAHLWGEVVSHTPYCVAKCLAACCDCGVKFCMWCCYCWPLGLCSFCSYETWADDYLIRRSDIDAACLRFSYRRYLFEARCRCLSAFCLCRVSACAA